MVGVGAVVGTGLAAVGATVNTVAEVGDTAGVGTEVLPHALKRKIAVKIRVMRETMIFPQNILLCKFFLSIFRYIFVFICYKYPFQPTSR
jgi:hypothetical protein